MEVLTWAYVVSYLADSWSMGSWSRAAGFVSFSILTFVVVVIIGTDVNFSSSCSHLFLFDWYIPFLHFFERFIVNWLVPLNRFDDMFDGAPPVLLSYHFGQHYRAVVNSAAPPVASTNSFAALSAKILFFHRISTPKRCRCGATGAASRSRGCGSCFSVHGMYLVVWLLREFVV